MVQSFWRDEAFSWYMAKKPILEMVTTTAKDFNPPFYYVLLHFWMNIFGSSEVVLRSLSLIFYALTIYIAYHFLKDIIKVNKNWLPWYLIVFSLNPLLLYYAFEVRMYTLIACISTLSFYLFYTKKWKWYMLVSVLGIYTHYYFLFVLLTQAIYTIFFTKEKKQFLKYLSVPYFLFLPWLLYSGRSVIGQTSGTFWMEKLQLFHLISLPGVLFTGYESSKYYNFYDKQILYVSLIVISLVILLVYKAKKLNNKLFPFLVLWSFLFFGVVALVSTLKPIFVPRYLIFCAIGFNLLIFFLLERISPKLRIVTLILLLVIIKHYTDYEIKYKAKGNIRATIKEINTISSDNDYLYVTDAGNYFVASYYFPEKSVRVYEEIQYIPSYVGLAAIPRDKISKDLPKFPQKAFILRSDYDYEIKSGL